MEIPIEPFPEPHGATGDPSEALASRLESLEVRLRAAGHPGEAIVERCRRHLARPRARIAFGGLFKAGKSTLLNGLLGRPVLPTDELPETGAVCAVCPGDEDRGRLIRTEGALEPMELEDVRRLAGLVDELGRRREERLGDLERLELTVAGTRIPEGAEWIDSPGIDDSPLMTAAAARAAERADLLVWVLSSRHPLTEQEMGFLAGRVERSGPASVLFVLNLIGGEESADEERLLRALEPKLAAFWGDLDAGGKGPPPVHAVDAQALAETGETATGELERLLHEHSRPGQPAILRLRAHRVAEDLQEVRRLLEGERARFAGLEERARKDREDDERRRAELRREVEEHLERFHRSWRVAAEAEMERMVPRVDVLLRATGAVQEDELRFPVALSLRAQEDLFEGLDEVAARRGLDPLHRPARTGLQGLLLPEPLGQRRIEAGRAGAGRSVAIGAATGSVVPGLGTAVGAVIGGAVAFHGRHRERERAAARVVAELRESLRLRLETVERRLLEVRDRIVESLAGPEPGPAIPPPEVAALEGSLEALDGCLELASDLARGGHGEGTAAGLPTGSSAEASAESPIEAPAQPDPSAEPDPLEERTGAFW